MFDRYSDWGNAVFYLNRELLKENYKDLIDLPFYLTLFRQTEYTLSKIKKDQDVKNCRKLCKEGGLGLLDSTDQLILGIIITGRCMTAGQLKAYYLLRAGEISSKRIKRGLERLYYLGLIARVRMQDTDDHSCYLKMYVPTNDGYKLGRAMHAPFLTIKKDCIIGEYYRGWGRFFKQSVIYNQIVLNQLLYNPSLRRFSLSDVSFPKANRYHIVPLCLMIDGHDYCFAMAEQFEYWDIKRTLDRWVNYKKERKREMTLVLIAYNKVTAAFAEQALKVVSDPGIHVVFTDAREWFREAEGTYLGGYPFVPAQLTDRLQTVRNTG